MRVTYKDRDKFDRLLVICLKFLFFTCRSWKYWGAGGFGRGVLFLECSGGGPGVLGFLLCVNVASAGVLMLKGLVFWVLSWLQFCCCSAGGGLSFGAVCGCSSGS